MTSLFTLSRIFVHIGDEEMAELYDLTKMDPRGKDIRNAIRDHLSGVLSPDSFETVKAIFDEFDFGEIRATFIKFYKMWVDTQLRMLFEEHPCTIDTVTSLSFQAFWSAADYYQLGSIDYLEELARENPLLRFLLDLYEEFLIQRNEFKKTCPGMVPRFDKVLEGWKAKHTEEK